jgi:hypothetical protein
MQITLQAGTTFGVKVLKILTYIFLNVYHSIKAKRLSEFLKSKPLGRTDVINNVSAFEIKTRHFRIIFHLAQF